ncbi:dihydrofolate reductase family protein [Ferroplasma sp.]|uniref:RibD family protein n=1 Tax=Ferroplasma sp. TaxID=2591003 RepID=UPI00307CF120
MLPYIIINVAMSLNGKISSKAGSYKISSSNDMKRVMKIRKSVDAVLVGANTVVIDDPLLKGSANRIVLDGQFKMSEKFRIFDGSINTYIFSQKDKNIPGARTVMINSTDIMRIMEKACDLGMKRILVEGGSNVILQFLKAKLFNEFYIYLNPGLLLSGKSLFPDLDIIDIDYTITALNRGILLSIKSIHI